MQKSAESNLLLQESIFCKGPFRIFMQIRPPFFVKFFTLILLKNAFKVMSDIILSFIFVIKGV